LTAPGGEATVGPAIDREGADEVTGRTRGAAPRAGEGRAPDPGAVQAYRWALGVFVFLVCVQVFLAGLGVFSRGDPPGFAPHRSFGIVIAASTIVVVALALLSRAGTRHVAGSVAILLMAGALQSGLADLGEEIAWIGGLHALDGMLIIGLAVYLLVDSGRNASLSRR
jgi:Family of unknown function (DUF6220)